MATLRDGIRIAFTENRRTCQAVIYTRDLKDVFAVQTELAQTIVAQLRGQLTGGAAGPADKEKIQAEVKAAEKGGTKNVEAHQQYLEGRFYENRNSEKGTDEALAAYQRAVELDPKFALAWSGVAQARIWHCNFSTEGGLKSFDAHLAAARDATARALALEPDLPNALFARAMIQMNFDYDWKAAGETLRKALAVAPQDPALLAQAGNLAGARGETAPALDFLSSGSRGRPGQRDIPLVFGRQPRVGEAV